MALSPNVGDEMLRDERTFFNDNGRTQYYFKANVPFGDNMPQ